jgi:hypothetical protein
MKGIHPYTFMHHIYTNYQIRLVSQPQRIMNPALKDTVKEELQKLRHANFIYPISDSKWVLRKRYEIILLNHFHILFG